VDDLIAALFARDTIIRHPSMLPPDLQECTVTLLSISTQLMAEKKNVLLTAEDGQKLAAATAASSKASVVYGLLDAGQRPPVSDALDQPPAPIQIA
jgi:hypothetical protein